MPTPVITHNQLGWAFQTGSVNNIKLPSSFLTTLYFQGREETLPTESVECSYKEGERLMAPFVEVNAEAIPVGGRSTTFANVSTPNIRIKRAMEAYNVFLRRQPGTGLFINGGGVVAAARQAAILEDASYMVELVENRLEWMVAQMLNDNTSGFINLSYQAVDRANWKVSIPRKTAMTVSLAGGSAEWDDTVNGAVGGGIAADFHRVKEAFSEHNNSAPEVCVMDKQAAALFLASPAVKDILDKRNVSAGVLEMQSQFNESGAIYLGTFCGIPCWEYARGYVDDTGAAANFMAANTAVFIGSGRRDGKIYYGAIPDHDAFEQGLFVGKRFSKSWKEQDPSIYVQLLQTRPLPMIRNPNAHYVLTVT